MERKIIVKIRGNAAARAYLNKIKTTEKLNGTMFSIHGSTYKVMIYGDIDDETYKRVLGNRKDHATESV